jgi:hypothetical protein
VAYSQRVVRIQRIAEGAAMRLYKFVPNKYIAQQVSIGVYRFYELTKYRKLEEGTGRSDFKEGSVTFTDDERQSFPEKMPIASYNGIEFRCASFSLGDDYHQQYFVFCMSTQKNRRAIGDCPYAVELDTDIFGLFEMLLPTPEAQGTDARGVKFFSHGPVEYYDIHNHPTSIEHVRWKEVYVKHSHFSYQHEYRAALFASGHFFERIGKKPMMIEQEIISANGNKMDFDLKLLIRSGSDEAGWRYIEFDVSEFQAHLLAQPCPVLTPEC